MRGSGFGAVAAMLLLPAMALTLPPAGAGVLLYDDDVDWEQAPSARSPAARDAANSDLRLNRALERRTWYTNAMADSSDGAGWGLWIALRGQLSPG